MKNYIFAAALSLFISSEMYAQETTAFGVSFAPAYTQQSTRASSELNWIENEWDRKESGKFGYALGIFAEKEVAEHWSARGGVGFSSIGERADSLLDLGVDKYNIDYRFIEVPIAVCYSFGKNKYTRPYVSLGYSLNYFLNKRTTYSLAGTNRDQKSILKGDEKNINHAVRMAFGFDFVLDKKWSLKTEIFASQFVTSLTNDGVRRMPFAAGLSIQFRKK